MRGFFSSNFSSALREISGSELFADFDLFGSADHAIAVGRRLNFETRGFGDGRGLFRFACFLQRVEKTRSDPFVAGFQFLCCFKIYDCCVELFVVAEEFGSFQQSSNVLRVVCEHAIEGCFRAGLIAICFLRKCERDPCRSGRFRNRSRAFGKLECFRRVAGAQANVAEQTQSESVLFVDRKGLAKLLFGFRVTFATHQECAERGVGK